MRVLFITSNRLGDAILSTGLLRSMADALPSVKFTIVCGPAAAGLFQPDAMPQLERLIVMQKRPWALHWWDLWKQVATTRWGMVVDLRGSGIGQFLLARRRRVFRGSGSRLHRVIILAQVLRLKLPAAPKIWIGEAQRKAARRLWGRDEQVLAIGPTANWGGKIWPGDRFAELALRLTAPDGILPNARIAVVGGPGEAALAQPVLQALPGNRVIDLVGKLDLLTLAAALERAAMYVGNDSGLMHLAAATGVPTLGLFGPSRPEVYGPWGEKTAAVRTDLSYDAILAQPGYDYRRHDSHMLTLSVDKAQRAAEDLWRDSRDPA